MEIKITRDTLLRTKELQNEFAINSRVQISDFLDNETSEQLLNLFQTQVKWKVAISTDKSQPQFLDQNSAFLYKLAEDARKRSNKIFQYVYNCLPMYGEHIEQLKKTPYLWSIYEFLNSDLFIGFVSEITNNTNLERSDGHLAQYKGGHFLGYHLDTAKKEEQGTRKVAFTIGLTKDWRHDWGGHTLFFSGTPMTFYKPMFNTLTLFSVPQPHLVTPISKYVSTPRNSIAGWVHSR